MEAEIEVLDLLRMACATLRTSKRRPELWAAAAKKEIELMAEIARLRTEAEPLLQPTGTGRG